MVAAFQSDVPIAQPEPMGGNGLSSTALPSGAPVPMAEEIPAPPEAYAGPEMAVDGYVPMGEACDDACGPDCYPYDDERYGAYLGHCCPLLYAVGGRVLSNIGLYAGVHGFKGPVDFGVNGNFGFHEGFNYGGPLGDPWGIGYQIGFEADHSNFYGDRVDGYETSGRDQKFLTAGLFHRPVCGGLQWGVAFDHVWDDYFDSTELSQIRTEISLARPCRGEIGFWGAFGTSEDELLRDGEFDSILKPTDIYALFVRAYYQNGGQGRIWAGATGDGEGILGADFALPVSPSWAIETNFTYLIPDGQATEEDAQQRETWGIALQLVWYPGGRAFCLNSNPFQPLLDVADNSWFLVGREQ